MAVAKIQRRSSSKREPLFTRVELKEPVYYHCTFMKRYIEFPIGFKCTVITNWMQYIESKAIRASMKSASRSMRFNEKLTPVCVYLGGRFRMCHRGILKKVGETLPRKPHQTQVGRQTDKG